MYIYIYVYICIYGTLESIVLADARSCDSKVTKALDAINSSSGRSLQTEVRIPTEVLSGNYGYGFSLGLMRKDVGQATAFLEAQGLELHGWSKAITGVLDEAVAASGEGGGRRDYTEVCKQYFPSGVNTGFAD